MNKVIWKYELEIADMQTFFMPEDAQILSVQYQDGQLCMWALVDSYASKEEVRISVVGTGYIFKHGDRDVYIGTVQDGKHVRHVFKL